MLAVLYLLLAALLGTLGYALLLRIQLRLLPAVSFAGTVSYGLYYLLWFFTGDLFLSNFAGALLAAILAYLFAICYRAPATLFYTPAIIPLVPGGLLYYMMSAAIRGESGKILSYGGDALLVGLGIASGIIVGVIITRILRSALTYRRRPSSSDN